MRECDADGCHGAAKKRGLCGKHYLRQWRHGDVTIAKKAANGAGQQFIHDVAIHYTGADCLIWPFKRGSGGYARIKVDGKDAPAHRLVCELVHGSPDALDMEATHTCGKGHLGCVNPKHLQWGTHQQNMQDKAAHGTQTRGEHHPVSKLSEGDVASIRSLRGIKTQRYIASLFSISPGHVCAIQTGKVWRT